jgi:hypothetical protein
LKYSRRTVVEVLKLLNDKTHADIGQLAFTHDMVEYSQGDNKITRITNLTQHLLKRRETDEDSVNEIVEFLLTEKLNNLKFIDDNYGDAEPFEQTNPALSRALEVDGFRVLDFKLVRQLPESIKLANHEDELFLLLEKHKFICKTNLVQAIDNNARGEWESSNAQLRTFVEALFNEMCDKIHGANVNGFSSTTKRDWLEKTVPPLLDPALGEIGEGGKNFSNGIMKRLHPKGAHPGLSDMEDCTFRLHLVALTASHYLRRFDKGVIPVTSPSVV